MSKKIYNINVGVGNSNVTNEYKISRLEFEITEDWFKRILQKHYTDDIKAKFYSDLFVDQGTGKEIINTIIESEKKFKYLENELRILNDWIIEFLEYFKQLKVSLEKENIEINENSRQFEQLDFLFSQSQHFLDLTSKNRELLSSDEIGIIHVLSVYDDTNLKVTRSFNTDLINEYLLEDKFIPIKPNDEEGAFLITMVFRRLTEIITQIQSVNALIVESKNQIYFINGSAGMGKSNLSAFVTTTLIDLRLPVIFIKARSFNGDPDQFDKILLEQLEVPDNYHLSEVLKKLNDFGKSSKKRVTLIIDGLNETSSGSSGFSHIWKNNLDRFLNLLKNYPYIFFISSLRTSYIERIWKGNEIPYLSKELIGFNNHSLLMDVVKKYFKHYNIKFNTSDKADIFYFQTPLLLDLYCKMLNPDRINEIVPTYGLEGFTSVFEKYIEKLAQKIKTDLGLISQENVTDGIQNCSVEMLKEMGAFLPISTYYSSIEGENIKNADDTIAYNILEEFLIYLKDSLNGKDVVVHTQQEVGGFLLAKALLHQNNNSINDLIKGDFFQRHIIGKEEDQHQLANDIMKFLIVISGEYTLLINKFSNVPVVQDYLWIKLQREGSSETNIELRNTLSKNLVVKKDISNLLENSKGRFFNPNSPLNFSFTKNESLKLRGLNFELTWTKFIYQNTELFFSLLKLDFYEIKDKVQLELILETTIWLLESTSHNLRDEASAKLLEYGRANPNFIFLKVEEYSNKERLYIYERLAGIAYGICLQKQNDKFFVKNELKKIAQTAYNLQFSSQPIAPSYHYIVIDSFKHIIDLAIYLEVFKVPERELERFNKYKFRTTKTWSAIDDNDRSKVTISWSSSPKPDPLSGDFVTYTIPRLLNRNHDGHLDAVAHIYKHLVKSGYEPKTYVDLPEGIEREFYFGVKKSETKGKIDRLGKKYSWNAFYEYAGFLLNSGQLPVFQKDSHDTSVSSYYDRLSDVKIEVSYPIKRDINKRIYSTDLFGERTKFPEWTYIEKFGTLDEVYNHQFESKEYTLLSGFYEESEKSKFSIEVRSFLMVESYLIKKEDILGKEHQISDRTMNWDHDLHSSGSISNTYFGELYWADSIPDMKIGRESIPSNLTQEVKPSHIPKRLTLTRLERKLAVARAEKGKQIIPIQIPFEVEPAVVEYSWETDSEVYPSLRGNIPSPNIGKHLNLKSDAKNFQILDEKLERAFISIEYEKDATLKQESDYIRTDLLKKYLDDKGLVLMYQIKQHTFDRNAGDGTGDFRGMQFKIIEL